MDYRKVFNELGKIDPDKLKNEFVHHSGVFSYLSGKMSQATVGEMESKHEMEMVYAKLFSKYKKEKGVNGKVTDKVVDSCVITDKDYENAYQKWFGCKKKIIMLDRSLKVMLYKKDMLVTLGYIVRKEMDSNISI